MMNASESVSGDGGPNQDIRNDDDRALNDHNRSHISSKRSLPRLPRLPLMDLQAKTITQYKNGLFYTRSMIEDDGGQAQLAMELRFKSVGFSENEGSAHHELKSLISLQKKKDHSLLTTLLGSNHFLSPRSGCLTPLSSARSSLSSGRPTSFSRECGSVPNSSSDDGSTQMKSGRSHVPPLADSLRSRFSKYAGSGDKKCNAADRACQDPPSKKGPLEKKLEEHGIAPVYEPKHTQSKQMYNMVPFVPDISDLRIFLVCPGPKCGGDIQCHIKRLGSMYSMFPRYKLYLTKGEFFLLSARKRKKSKTSNYIISLDEDEISNKTGTYFGNVKSNFLGTKFWFYDKGEPATIRHHKFCYNWPTDRVELGAVLYESKTFGIKGPRKFTVVIPSIDEDDKSYIFQPQFGSSASILDRYRHGFDLEKMVIMRNKMPLWNQELKSYCLNFNGRATHASIKNFQLIIECDEENVILQLGKIGKNLFTMDYKYPLSALQAFSICLSTLDQRLH